MIVLQFSAAPTLGSWAIRWYTRSDYSHVDFVLPDGRLLGALFGQGVCIHEPRTDYIRADRFTVDAPVAVLNAALSHVGAGYDYAAFLGFVSKEDWHRRSRFICSEFVEHSFAEAGYPLLRSTTEWRLAPEHLLLSPYLTPVV